MTKRTTEPGRIVDDERVYKSTQNYLHQERLASEGHLELLKRLFKRFPGACFESDGCDVTVVSNTTPEELIEFLKTDWADIELKMFARHALPTE